MANPDEGRGVCPAHPDTEVNLRINCNGRVYFLHAPCGCEHRYPRGMPIEKAVGFKPLIPRNDTYTDIEPVTNTNTNSKPIEIVPDDKPEPELEPEPAVDPNEEEEEDEDDGFWD